MRNLKRALSLTLASVMLLGMMVVGSSAKGYDDVTEDNNVEAIEVLQTIEVMVGDERGFGPDRPVNRAEMAVVMGKLLSLDYNYYATSCPFNDVYDWARGYVGACYANKIVSGRGDGVYDPGATVTAVEAASMLMRALGYFQYANDVADGFELSTVRQGTKIGIFDGVGSSATAPMTRDQVAQMVLNALQSDVVEPDGNTINLTTPDGTVLTGKVNYVSVTRDEPFAYAIDDTRATSVGSNNDGWIVELGERLYNGDLKLHEYEDDTFMRPSRTWEYKGKEIGTYMKVENIRETYTEAVNARTLYDLLGRTNLEEYTFNYYEDGESNNVITAAKILTRSTSDFKTTGRGVLTQVFVDVEARTIDITSINTYLAKATVDYSTSTEKVTLQVYTDVTYSTSGAKRVVDTDEHDKIVSLADVDNITGLKQDDYVLVNVSGKDNTTAPVHNTLAGYDIVVVKDVEVMSDTKLTKFSKDSDSDNKSNSNEALFKSVVAEGTEYKGAKRAYYSDEVLDLYDNDLLVNKTYNIYLDPYGNAIGIDLFSGEDNYVFITGVDLDSSNISLGTAKAAAIFVDGTMKTITVDVRDTNKNIAKVDSLSEGAGDSSVAKSYFEKWVLGTGDPAHKNSISDKAFIVNRWYTYTVDANNEYTLNPATRMFTTEVLSGDDELDKTIKCNSVRIDEQASMAKDNGNSDEINRYAAGNNTQRAFGNDNSVFIVVEADEKVTNSNDYVINDVSGVYTGVQNVEIEVNTTGKAASTDKVTDTELADQIYTLYDKNNYIIASVILGEAKGSNANYAFILTAGTSEELLADGTHQWEFDAVVDGKVTTLTARSKFSKTVMGLEPGHVQELRYSGEYVTGVKTPNDGTKYYTDPTSGKINKMDIYDVGHVAHPGTIPSTITDAFTATNGIYLGAPDCSVTGAHTYGTKNINSARISTATATDLRVVGRTMYLKPDDQVNKGDYGLTFVENAPAVVIQKQDGSTKKINCGSVREAIGLLGDPVPTTSKKEFQGRIVAVLNNQDVAEWIVFVSDTPVNSAGVSVPGGPADGASMPSPFWNGTAIEVPYYKTIPTSDALKTMIEPVTGPIKTMSFNMVVTEDGMYYPIALTEYIAIKIDGTPAKYVKVGAPHGDVTGLTNGTSYLSGVKYKASVDYTAASKKITVSASATSQTDVELYTACKIDLENGVTAKYGTTTVNDNEYVAKGEEVTFSGVLSSGRHSYKVNDVTYGQAITGAVKPLTLTITGDTKVDEAASYRISILGKDLGEHAAGAKVEFTSAAPKTALSVKKGTAALAQVTQTEIDATKSTWTYEVTAGDAHTDGTITIVAAYTIAAQTGETGIGNKISLSRKTTDGDADTTVADGTTLVEVGATVYVQGTATKGVMINPAVTNSGITGLTAEAVGTSTNKVYSFKMPAKAVANNTFCYDWYRIAAQTNAGSTGITFSLDAEGTKAVSATTHVVPGTTVYATASVENKAITATSPTLTTVTAPSATAKGVYSFTMGIADVAANALTQAG